MRSIQLILATLLFTALQITVLQAQKAIPTTGGEASGIGGSVSYSIGQVANATKTGVNGSVAEGVQQPFEISEVIGQDGPEGVSLLCTAFPNPTTDFLTLKIDASSNLNLSSLNFQLFNLDGKIIDRHKLEDYETKIDMSHLKPKTYLLKVMDGNKALKTFKIIKN